MHFLKKVMHRGDDRHVTNVTTTFKTILFTTSSICCEQIWICLIDKVFCSIFQKSYIILLYLLSFPVSLNHQNIQIIDMQYDCCCCITICIQSIITWRKYYIKFGKYWQFLHIIFETKLQSGYFDILDAQMIWVCGMYNIHEWL